MLSEQKEVSKKRSGKLLFWNKKTSKLAQSHQLRNSPAMLLKQNGSVERDSHIIIIFKIKIKTLTVAQSHQLIVNSPPKLLEQIKSLGRGVANCYCEIKITSKLAQTHQSIENSQSMLSEQKEVSKKRSGKLLFWNKKASKCAQAHQTIGNSHAMLFKQKWVIRKRSCILLFSI